jgi:hypothetical protein
MSMVMLRISCTPAIFAGSAANVNDGSAARQAYYTICWLLPANYFTVQAEIEYYDLT